MKMDKHGMAINQLMTIKHNYVMNHDTDHVHPCATFKTIVIVIHCLGGKNELIPNATLWDLNMAIEMAICNEFSGTWQMPPAAGASPHLFFAALLVAGFG